MAGVIENSLLTRITGSRWGKALLAILILGALFFGYRSLTRVDFEAEVAEATRKDLAQTISAAGSVSAEKFAQLTFLATEDIEEIVVEDGTFVEEGEIIARLNTTSLYQSYLQAEADLRDAQATLDRVYDELQGKEAPGEESFEEIEDRTAAETAKDKAYRALVIAQNNLGNATLRAPFSGIVNYNDGTSVGRLSLTTSPTFTIVDPETIFFEAEVNEVDITSINKGTKAQIILDAFSDKAFQEEVSSVGFVSIITSTGGTAYKVRTFLPQTEANNIRVGMNGDVDFIISEKEDVLTIPQTALIEESDASYVWLLERGQAVRREIKTGLSSIDDVEVVEGLAEGERVILSPPSDIEEGSRVRAH